MGDEIEGGVAVPGAQPAAVAAAVAAPVVDDLDGKRAPGTDEERAARLAKMMEAQCNMEAPELVGLKTGYKCVPASSTSPPPSSSSSLLCMPNGWRLAPSCRWLSSRPLPLRQAIGDGLRRHCRRERRAGRHRAALRVRRELALAGRDSADGGRCRCWHFQRRCDLRSHQEQPGARIGAGILVQLPGLRRRADRGGHCGWVAPRLFLRRLFVNRGTWRNFYVRLCKDSDTGRRGAGNDSA